MQRLFLFCLALLASVSGGAAEPARLIVNGQARVVLFERPAGQGPHPTILMLHGGGGAADQEMRLSGLGQLGPRQGFAAVFPEAIRGIWNFFPPGKEATQHSKYFQPYGGLPDDVAFLKKLVADLVHNGMSDPKRIYLAGRSLGGVMVLRLACLDAGTFAAIGLLISAMPSTIGSDCLPSRPLPLLTFNATHDRILPYNGERYMQEDVLWSTRRLVAFFSTLNGCTVLTPHAVPAGQEVHNVVIDRATGCVGGPVILYRIVGGEHDVPATLNASQALLDFFRDKTR